jgi:hypothetical protein
MHSVNPEFPEHQCSERLNALLQAVLGRGAGDEILDSDDYAYRMQHYEVRELVVLELYDTWIPPPRHEHELQIIREIVAGVLESRVALFAATAAAGGIIGNASYDVIKRMLISVCVSFRSRKRCDPFRRMKKAVEDLETFFSLRDEACESDIADGIGIRSSELRPLLKLLGFRRRRHKKKSIWHRHK